VRTHLLTVGERNLGNNGRVTTHRERGPDAAEWATPTPSAPAIPPARRVGGDGGDGARADGLNGAAAPRPPDDAGRHGGWRRVDGVDGGDGSRTARANGGAAHRAGDMTEVALPAGGELVARAAVDDADVAPPTSGVTRRTTIVLRYLLGRLAVDHLRRLTRWAWLVPVLGLFLLLVRPRWIGMAVFVLGVLLLGARAVAAIALDRLSLAHRFRSSEHDLRSAVEAGKASLRVELRRAGLPSRSWHLPVFALRLARGSARADTRSRLRQVDVDRVLPRAQLDRALRALDDATDG
jgi:hypothetical protein